MNYSLPATGYILLQVLEFFLHHGEVVLYDPEPLFRQYFDGFVAETFVDPLMAIETLIFLARHKVVLSNTSNVFQQHFHVILRILAWFPVESVDLVAEILPACIGPNTCLELFHTLLDLPLLSAALERLHRDHQHATTAANERGGSGSQSYSGSVLSNQSASEHYGILFNMLLRKESGIVVNFWDSVQTMNQVKEFSTEVEKAGGTTTSSPNSSPNLTRRLAACGDAVATLCNTFYDVVTAYADETLLQQLVGLAIERMDQLACYMHPVKATIRNILLQRTLAIIRKHPVCVVNLKETIMQVIGESIHNPARRELLLHLCWSVGEYASPVLLPSCTSQLLFDYEEALELLLFEVIALTAAEITAARDHNPTAQRSGSIKKKRGEEDEENDGLEPEFSEIEEAIQSNAESTGGAAGAGTATQSNYQLRLMLVIISAITKLASRWQPLASRVVLCLTNIVPKAEMVHPSLLDRVNHSLAMIQQPSIAANLFETPLTGASSGPAIASTHHLDSRSSLRFLLQPVSAPLSVMEIELAAASSFLDRTDVSDEDEEETEDDMDDGTTKNDAPMRRGSQPLMAELPRW
jgi:AP-5 complex subunit zeta-1